MEQTVAQGRALLAKADPLFPVFEQAPVGGGAARRVEGVAAVAGKTAGKVTPVIRILPALHADLIAAIQLRNAAAGQQESVRQTGATAVAVRQGGEAHDVMVAVEGHQAGGI